MELMDEIFRKMKTLDSFYVLYIIRVGVYVTEVISMREQDEPTSERVLLASGRYVLFGPFRIDQQRQEVTRNGSRLKLQGKVYQVLLTLLEKPGEVVTREELRMRLWPARYPCELTTPT